jgi:hypothetical protein
VPHRLEEAADPLLADGAAEGGYCEVPEQGNAAGGTDLSEGRQAPLLLTVAV